MTKLNFAFATLLVGGAFAAGSFSACSKDNAAPTEESATKADGTCVTGAYQRMGVCACQEGMPNVCNQMCTDRQVDPANCGTCNHACDATSTCQAGTCGAAPTVVMPAVAGCTGMTIATNNGGIFYTDEAHNSVSKVGGSALSTAEMGPTWLQSFGANLYWYNKGSKTIRMIPAAGGTAMTIYTAPTTTTTGVGGFLVTADAIYVSVDTTVVKLPAAGGGAGTVIVSEDHGGIPGALALNGTTNIVYPTTLNGDVDAAKLMPAVTPASCGKEDAMMNVIMTDCPRLARSQGELFTTWVASIGGKAFWIDGQNLKMETINGSDQTFDTVTMTMGGSITAAVASTDTIYFASGGDENLIEKTPLVKDSIATPIARGQKAAQSMALDASKVYWATSDCSIGSTAR
jgi:hypothetical protein